MSDRPEVNFVWGKTGENMQSWTSATKNGKSAYSCRGIYWAKVIKSNGWSLNGNWKWSVNTVGFYVNNEADETWGDNLEKRKVGGYIYADEIGEFKMIFTGRASFEKDGVIKEFGWQREIIGIDNVSTGKAVESATMPLDDDEEDDDDEDDDDIVNPCQDYIEQIKDIEIVCTGLQSEIKKLTDENAGLKKESVDTPLEWFARYWQIWKYLLDIYKDKNVTWFKRYVINSSNAFMLALPVLLILWFGAC